MAFYGSLPGPWSAAVSAVQGLLGERLGPAFVARTLGSVHSTIIGLDGSEREPDHHQAGLLGFLAAELRRRPLTLQLGGFGPDERTMLSRGRPLHERSVTTSREDVLLVGWPVDADGAPTRALHDLRVGATAYGFEHRYPLTEQDPDPDAHLVIGTLVDDPGTREVAAAVAEARDLLATSASRVPLGVEDLTVVTYTDRHLPADSTTAVPVVDLLPEVR